MYSIELYDICISNTFTYILIQSIRLLYIFPVVYSALIYVYIYIQKCLPFGRFERHKVELLVNWRATHTSKIGVWQNLRGIAANTSLTLIKQVATKCSGNEIAVSVFKFPWCYLYVCLHFGDFWHWRFQLLHWVTLRTGEEGTELGLDGRANITRVRINQP